MALNVKEKIDGVVTPDLKKKVAAWWQGVDVNDLDWPDDADREHETAAEEDLSEEPAEQVIEVELSHYIKVSEMLWGEGYVTPGGSNFIDLWGQQLSLNKEKSTAFLGAGLGGQARELNKSTGSWVTGYDRHPELIEVAADQNMMAGLSKKVTAEYYSPEDFELEENKFNAIVSKEEFSTIENKERIFEQIARGLRTSGLFMFSEYVAMDEGISSDRLKELFGEMLGRPSLWTEAQYVAALEKSGLDIHVNEELSDTYVRFINKAWGGYRDLVTGIRDGKESDLEKAALLKMIGISAELWTHISSALDSGEIQLRRFLARKT